MLRTTLAGLRARKARLALSSIAVALGVALVTGVLTLTASVKDAYFDRFAAQARHVDAAVRPESGRLPAGLLDTVRAVPGVAAAVGRMRGTASLLGRDGRPAGGLGTAVEVAADPRLRTFTLTAGRLPASAAEALVDGDTAAHAHLRPGDTATVVNARQTRRLVRLVGTIDPGVDGGGSPVIALTPGGVRAVTGVRGYDRIDVAAAPGVDRGELVTRLRAVTIGGTVITGTRLAHDLADGVTHQTDLFLRGLLLFGLVALVVAALVIFNTFTTLIAQRTREVALLRCVGATRRQVFAGVVTEALATGFAGSACGVAAGFGVAAGMRGVLGLADVPPPPGGLMVTPGTVLAGLAVGVVVTVAAALFPAYLATRMAPVAGLRTPNVGRRLVRSGVAAVFAAAGTGLFAAGIPRGQEGLILVVGGGCVFFLGVLAIGPVLAGPLAAVIGWLPSRLGGVPARLAVAGARRNPARTATTMIALTIGVGLMTLFSVVLATAAALGTAQIERSYPADYVIDTPRGDVSIPAVVAARLRAQPAIAVAAELRTDVSGGTAAGRLAVATLDPSAFGTVFRPRLAAGSLRGLGAGEIALDRQSARRLGAHVGGTVTVPTPEQGPRPYRLTAVFTTRFVGEQALMAWPDFTRGFGPGGARTVLVQARRGADARAAVDRVMAAYPVLVVNSVASYKAQLTSSVNQVTALLGAMLAGSVLIALFGIANTLSLSVIERTAESALLRALGLTRRQLRRTLSAEALLVGLMGGLIGVAVGCGFGWAVSRTFLHDAGGGPVSYPVPRIAGYLALAGLAGLFAALVPARRAARASVIDGLSHE